MAGDSEDTEERPLSQYVSPRKDAESGVGLALVTPTRRESVPEVRDTFEVDVSGAVRAQPHSQLLFACPRDGESSNWAADDDIRGGGGRDSGADGSSPIGRGRVFREHARNAGPLAFPLGSASDAMSTGRVAVPPRWRSLAMGQQGMLEMAGDEFLAGPSTIDASPNTSRPSRDGEFLDVSGDGTIRSPSSL